MRKRPHIRSHRHRNPRRHLPLEFMNLVVQHRVLPRRRGRRRSMLREVLEDRERRHRRNVPLLHQLHRVLAQLCRVVDRRYPRLRRIQRPRLALRMHAHIGPQPRRFLHARLQLRLRVLVRRMKIPKLRIARHPRHPRLPARNHRIRPRLVHLHERRSLLVLLPNRRHNLIRVVRVIRVAQHVLRGIEVVRVLMSAQKIDGIAADPQPWPRNQSLVNRPHHRRIR